MLIVYELRSREMTRTAKLRRVHDRCSATLDRFGDDDLLDLRRALLPRNLGAEREHIVSCRHDGRAVDRRESGDQIDNAGQRILPRATAVARRRGARRAHHRAPPPPPPAPAAPARRGRRRRAAAGEPASYGRTTEKKINIKK